MGVTPSGVMILEWRYVFKRLREVAALFPLLTVGSAMSGSLDERLHEHRLRILGTLVSGVAHDFNNMLTGILGHVTYLKSILPSTGSHAESLLSIEQGAKKASMITRQILDFARSEQDLSVVRCNVCAVVRHVTALLKGGISPLVTVSVQVPPEPLMVSAVDGRIAQVVANLITNARDAVGVRGTIAIEVSESVDADLVGAPFYDSSARYVQISVRDDGAGMTPAVQEQIFLPFFSTKSAGAGTGLGLSTVLEIVQLYGGGIRVLSEEGKGTTVQVFFKLDAPQAPVDQEDESVREILPGGNERILVMDDENPVRNVLVLSLEHLGYQVTAVASGTEALDAFRDTPQEFDLAILDMLLPSVSGDEVFRELRTIHPSLKILIMSGYSPEDRVNGLLAEGGSLFIQKPFTIGELAQKVRQSLDTL